MSMPKWMGIIAALAIVGFGLLFSNDLTKHQSHSTPVEILASTSDDIVGQWRSVVENPTHPNTVAQRYMRHTFFSDGELVVENEENNSISYEWRYDNGIFIATRSSGTNEFIEHFRLIDRDTLEKVLFQSTIGGKPLANYNPEDEFIRQGSGKEGSMEMLDIFASANSAMNFVDPSTLSVGSSYTLSRKTPIAPDYVASDLAEIRYAPPGQMIEIIEQTLVENKMWYRVRTGDSEGWINSIALFGQDLN
ncbi:50S ribosomal protein L2 [Roseovarius sp. 217]|nr:50S ribosomal protein L2 [Roseovarius sp. 217]